jgi:prevent-host-death family protein
MAMPKVPGFKIPERDRSDIVGRRTPALALSRAKRWQMQDAKARLSRLVKDAQSDGPQIITLHGEEVAIVQSIQDYQKSQHAKADQGPNLFAALLKCPPGPDLVIHRDPNDVVGAGTPNIFD